jgi:hypothetical protein
MSVASTVKRGLRWGLVVGAALAAQLAVSQLASADPNPTAWHRLRVCESSDNYRTNTGNGYYGAYQFNLGTWRGVGGRGYPHQASRAEQNYRALYLYRMRGWGPWGCAGSLGLTADRDAASHRVPTYSDAASM